MAALAPLALKARHPQTQQYAIRALKKYGAAARAHVPDLRDLARNPAQRDYVRAAAATVADAIEQASADATAGVKHRCQRCGAAVTTEEQARSQAELQAMERRPMTMRDWIAKLDAFLRAGDRDILEHTGSISAEEAKHVAELEFEKFERQRRELEDAQADAQFAQGVETLAKKAKQLKAPKKQKKQSCPRTTS